MTIIVGITSPDGIVLAGDSRTTQSSETGHRIVSDHAQKVFDVHGFAVATSGMAFIGSDTIAGLMDQFIAEHGTVKSIGIDEFATALSRFFDERFTQFVEAAEETWDPATETSRL